MGIPMINFKSARKIHAQVFVWIYVFISLLFTPRSRTVRSCAKYMFNLKKIKMFSKMVVTILHSHQQCMRVIAHSNIMQNSKNRDNPNAV